MNVCHLPKTMPQNLETFNLSKYHYPDALLKQQIQKAQSISQQDLERLKEF